MKKYLTAILILTTAILIYFLFIRSDADKSQAGAAPGIERFPYPPDRLAESHSDYIMADVNVGRIDLALELVKLRRDCAGEVDDAGCNDRIRKMILALPGKDKEKLIELFDQYLQFEAKMKQSPLANAERLSDAEKYRLLKKARRDFFGEDNARLIFGVEEARIALLEEQQKFNSPEYTNLPADERLRLYEDRKKELLGPYYQTTREREPPDIKYGTEMMLQQAELAKMPESERARAVHDLRVKHFGEAYARRITDDEKQQSQALNESVAKMDEFLAAEREYLGKNASLSDEEKRAGVDELRKKILGK